MKGIHTYTRTGASYIKIQPADIRTKGGDTPDVL
jgi:hypothetical protein